jgi:Uma2 family endonuclease
MATILPTTSGTAEVLPLWRFSNDTYLKMIDCGVLGPNDRVELIRGMVVDLSPSGSRHSHFLAALNRLFLPTWERGEVWIQGTMIVAEGEIYDPDFMLLRTKPGGYKEQLPRPTDVLLVVEAADSSLRRDQQVKLPIYASAMIPEYWIADLQRESLVIHRDPQPGGYRLVESWCGDDIVSPLAVPNFSFAVRKAFE